MFNVLQIVIAEQMVLFLAQRLAKMEMFIKHTEHTLAQTLKHQMLNAITQTSLDKSKPVLQTKLAQTDSV
jgi:hypothetical protein